MRAQQAWKLVDVHTEDSGAAFEAWIQASLIESQALDYLDERRRAESTARRSLGRAERTDPKGQWRARSEIRVIETREWRQDLVRASLDYCRLAGKLEDVDWGQPLALVCYYQMISCGLKGAPADAGELAIAQGEILVPMIKEDDIVGSFKRWKAINLADRANGDAQVLDDADDLLHESEELKPIETNRRMKIGESFPVVFLEFTRENPDAEMFMNQALGAAKDVGLEQYVRGAEMLFARFRE